MVELEIEILSKVHFEIRSDGPLRFLERYLRLLNLQENTVILTETNALINEMAKKSKIWLEKTPSIVAASALVFLL